MSKNPLNLALRFLLELAAMFAVGYWGWVAHQGVLRYVLTVGLLLAFAFLWGVFSVPGDRPSAPVPVSGFVRLLLEIVLFGGAVLALYAAGRPGWAVVLLILLMIHYGLSYDRVLWLMRH